MSAVPLFAYGTLRDGDILAGVLGRDLTPTAIRSASASGYRAVYCPGQVYPVLAPAPDGVAPGVVLDGLTLTDFAILDAFEGPLYRRTTIAVTTGAGSEVASAYLPVKPVPADAAPGRWNTGPYITSRRHWRLNWTSPHVRAATSLSPAP